jgi:hypothetical protein
MNPLLRKLRGVIGTGLAWGTAWATIMAAVGVVVGVLRPEEIDPGEGPIVVGAIMGMVGFVSGLAFGALLSFAERRKTILDLSPGRAALWGILASAVFPLLTGRADAVFVLCPLGAACAAASVALARRAELRNPTQPKLLRSEPLPR